MVRIVFTVLVIWVSMVNLKAQNTLREVSGTVKDAITGEELVGVNLIVEGNSRGAITDAFGKFTVSIPESGVLRVSSLGYVTKNIDIATQTDWNILLDVDQIQIEELVVVGYAVQKRRDVLGAVSKVDGNELTKVVVPSAQQALQGRIAGVQVSAQTGAPGANVAVRIRGVGSISSGNDPLYIVDGVPVEGALNTLSPNEIESISVLKDASSAAIYGSRANNGVILITTKSGKAGKAKITYNTQVGFQQPVNLIKMVSTDQYIELYNEAARTDNITAAIPRTLIEGNYIKDFANVNHQKEIMRTALIQNHEVSVSGGSDKVKYLVMGSYFDQQGIIKGSDYNRFTLRANLNADVKKWLTVGLNVNGGISNTASVPSSGDGYQNSEGGSVVRYALFRNPAIPVYKADGALVDLPSEYYGNPLYNSFFGDGYSPEGLIDNNDRKRMDKMLLATGTIQFNLPKNIYWKNTFGLDYRLSDFRQFNKTWGTANRINSTNSLNVNQEMTNNMTFNSTFTQAFEWATDHQFNYMIGMEIISNSGTGSYMTDQNFADNNDTNFHYIGKGEGPITANQSVWDARLLSFFGSVNYNYKHKYYISATLRQDGSSRFSKGNRWGTFYSVSGGWNIESESFMQSVDWLNKLKLRAGYGSIGNQNIGLYAFNDRYSPNYYYPFGGVGYNGYVQTTLGNRNLKWETSNQFNAGLDVEFLKGMYGLTVDYFYKVTSDMLVQSPLPPSVGTAQTPWINSGNVLNTGVDFEVFYRKNFKDGGIHIALNGGYLHNEVLSLDAPILGGRIDNGVYATKTEVGYPIGSFFLYEMEGVFQNRTEILTHAYQGKGIQPGDVKYKNHVQDNVINAQDRVHMGSAIPLFTTGLNVAGNYKGFDLNLFFQGAFGQKIYNQINHDIEGFYRGFNVTERYYNQRWTVDNPSNTQPRASWSSKGNNVMASSRFLEDGSYFRLKNVQLGYTIPNTRSWGVENLRIYLTATNLFTITSYSGMDPEMTVSANAQSEGDRAGGIDWGTYPAARSFMIGLNLTF